MKIIFNDYGFTIRNLSKQRRIDFDGRGMDETSLKTGEKIKFSENTLSVLKLSLPLPFSRIATISFNGKKQNVSFLLNSQKQLNANDLKLRISYIPPHFFLFNLYILELILFLIFISLAVIFYAQGKISQFIRICPFNCMPFTSYPSIRKSSYCIINFISSLYI